VGKDGLLSTPAVSRLIRKGDEGRPVNGGIILTASHNPGGPKYDFGIKFNCDNGGPAPDAITNKIHQLTTMIAEYKICPELNVDFGQTGSSAVMVEGVGNFVVKVVDSVADYVSYMEEIFDFSKVCCVSDMNSHLLTGMNIVGKFRSSQLSAHRREAETGSSIFWSTACTASRAHTCRQSSLINWAL